MKNIKKILSALILSFILFSCKGFYSEQNKSSGLEKSDGKTYLVVGSATLVEPKKKVDRTIIQNYIEDLTDFELTGTISGGTEKTLATVPTFAKLSGAKIPLDAGIWNFKLKANLGEVQFSGNTGDVVIEAGKTNTISFELTAQNQEYGGLQIKMTFTGKADKVIADLYDENKSNAIADRLQEFTSFTPASDDPDNNMYSFIYKLDVSDDQQKLANGTYYLKFDFYYRFDKEPAEDIPTYEKLNTTSAFIRVGNGINTKADLSIDLNEVYTITYEDNGGSLAVDEIKVLNYSRKSEITLPQMDGTDEYTDFLGWYTDEAFAEDSKIEEIKNRTGSIILHARYRTPADVVSQAVSDIIALTESGTVTVTGKLKSGNITIGQENKTALKYIKDALDTLKNNETDPGNPQILVTLNFDGMSGLTQIEDEAFKDCKNLQAITIPDCINTIGVSSFTSCTTLKSVVIPDSVTTIKAQAFYDCPQLETTEYENACYLGNNTNPYVLLLKPVNNNINTCTINPNCKFIPFHAFQECKSLSSITVDSANTYFCAVDGVLYNKNMTKLIYYPSAKAGAVFTIPASVTEIEEQSFNYANNIQSVIIPQGVNVMPAAFNNCSGLKSIVIPSSLNTIGKGVFNSEKTEKLTDIYSRENKGTFEIGSDNEIFTSIYNGTGHWHSNCKIITFDTTTNWTGNTASIYPHILKESGSIVPLADDEDNSVSNNIITAQEYTSNRTGYAFKGWYTKANPESTDAAVNLTNATLTADTTLYAVWEPITAGITVNISPSNDIELTTPEIDVDTKTVTFTASLSGANSSTTYNWFVDGTKQTETSNIFIFSPTASDQRAYTIEVISGTHSATVMVVINFVDIDAVTSQISNMTESGTVTISGVMGSSELAGIKAALTSLKTSAPEVLVTLDMSDVTGLTAIPDNQFKSLNNLESIILPEGLETIGSRAFEDCKKLSSVSLPNSITSLGEYGFSRCESLVDINIPAGVSVIKAWTFQGCRKLEEVTIPETVKEIQKGIFAYCNLLKTVTINEGVKTINENTFQECFALESITLPKSLTTLGNNVFIKCEALQEIKVADGSSSFSSQDGVLYNYAKTTLLKYPDAKNGTTFAIPSSVITIGQSAFYGNKNLTSMDITSGVKTIDYSAFFGCENLTSVSIPNTVTTIRNQAFIGCAMTTVNIPESVTTIGAGAFMPNISSYVLQSTPVLVSITVDEGNTKYSSQDGVLYDKNKTTIVQYPAAKSDESFTIPSTVTTINTTTIYGAFEGAINLKSVVIPDGITKISANAFSVCNSLETITIPASVTTIEANSFKNSNKLTTVNYKGSAEQKDEMTISDTTISKSTVIWNCDYSD